MAKIGYTNKIESTPSSPSLHTGFDTNEIKASVNILYDRYFNVDDNGAVGDGVTDDTAAIQSAINAAGAKGVVYFTSGKTYIVKDTALFPLDGQYWIGYGAVLKRGVNPNPTITAAAVDGTGTVLVSSSTGFSVGDTFVIIDETSPNGGKGYDEHSLADGGTATCQISAINGTTWTLGIDRKVGLPANGNLDGDGEFPIGAPIMKNVHMIWGGNSTNISKQLNLEVFGLTFDGNRDNNDHNYDFNLQSTLVNMRGTTKIIDCKFYNIPNENIYAYNNTWIEGCTADGLNGSFVHSTDLTWTDEGHQYWNNNNIRNVCEVSRDLNNHNEGAFTFSSNSKKIIITNNFVSTSGTGFAGRINPAPTANADQYIIIANNQAFDCSAILHFEGNDVLAYKVDVIISNNIFDTCEELYVITRSNGFIYDGGGIDKLIITNNLFINAKLHFSNTSNLTLKDNHFVTDFGHTYSTSNNTSSAAMGATVSMTICDNVDISGNLFENNVASEDAQNEGAVIIETTLVPQYLKTGAGNTDYLYSRHINVSDNTIIGYGFGIWGHKGLSEGNARRYGWIGVKVNNNTIVLRSDANAETGLFIEPGYICSGNMIYGSANAVRGILLFGVNDGTGSSYTDTDLKNRINGPVCFDNTIIGFAESIQVGRAITASAGNHIHNIICVRNFITGVIDDDSGSGSTVSDNITLPIDETPSVQLIRENTNFY